MKKSKIASTVLLLSTVCSTAWAGTVINVPMYLVSKAGHGKSIGTVSFSRSPYGVLITPNLHGLPPGMHGFHIHQQPSCADDAMAAGGHLDPNNTKKHLGPYQDGHLGDLPTLYVNQSGDATQPILAPRLTMSDLPRHSLMIHAGGDNYSDQPKPLGGGGARIACGLIK